MPIDHSEKFQATILDSEAWKRSADALIEAAVLLEPKIDEFWQDVRTDRSWNDGPVAIYFMLCSFALENLLKSQIVDKKRDHLTEALRSAPVLPVVLRNHDLYWLMCEAGLNDLAAEEESLLHRLTRSAVWYGRYPAPVKAPDLSSLRKSEHDEGFNVSLTQYTSTDRDDIKRLLRALG